MATGVERFQRCLGVIFCRLGDALSVDAGAGASCMSESEGAGEGGRPDTGGAARRCRGRWTTCPLADAVV